MTVVMQVKAALSWMPQRVSAAAGRQNTVFIAPSHLRHTIDAYEAKGFANITAAYCVPVSPGRSRVLVKQPFRFKFPVPALAFSTPPSFALNVCVVLTSAPRAKGLILSELL
jgi:hypothetical protein